ncbi:MAG: hypothetical protein KC680_00540 [Candidatus Peregrinibacteria bacterium]|nr:hypothetical protein [Candidatus Peregrinibacteria bacterium]MCB9807851.1 hypothetical protein [Candidatus Peribacteria bacterium]
MRRVVTMVLLFLVALPVQAATYFENVHYIQRFAPTNRTYTYPYRVIQSQQHYPQYRYSNTTTTRSNCLYANVQGECMIEQYYDPYVPSYNNRYYDDYYYDDNRRYDYYDYYDDDDDWVPRGFFDNDDDD